MKIRTLIYRWGGGLALSTGLCTVAMSATAGSQPDNTRVNARDQKGPAPTADQQSNEASDVQLTARIRREIVQQKNLSTYAHNVKIISENGEVVLRGPVRSEDEKQRVGELAKQVAGAVTVKNELEIATK